MLVKFADMSITCSKKDYRTKDIVKDVQTHHHTQACRKYSTNCRFSFPRFPSLRTLVSVPFNKFDGTKEEKTKILEESKALLKKVTGVLEDEDKLESIVSEEQSSVDKFVEIEHTIGSIENILSAAAVKKSEITELSLKMLHDLKDLINYDSRITSIFVVELKNILKCLKQLSVSMDIEGIKRRRLLKLLSIAGIEGKDDKDVIEVYEDALSVSKSGYRILHKRDIDECYINNYNTEWIISWNSNMDLQVCLDYYGIITYISNYFSKDDTGTVPYILEALKKALNQSLQNRLSVVANIFLTHRQIGESEAFYKILPHLQMKYSNIDCVFLPTGFKKNRSSFLMELNVDEAKNCADVIQVENKDGLFTEKPSMIDKFERMDRSLNKCLQELTYIQFAMKYVSSNAKSVQESDFESMSLTEDDEGWHLNDEMDLIVTHDFNVLTVRHTLPKYIKLLQIKPGEPKYMRKRSYQNA